MISNPKWYLSFWIFSLFIKYYPKIPILFCTYFHIKLFFSIIETIFNLDLNIAIAKQNCCTQKCLSACNQLWASQSHCFELGPVTSNLLLARKLEWIPLKSILVNVKLMKYITHSFKSESIFQNIHNVNNHLYSLVSFVPQCMGFVTLKWLIIQTQTDTPIYFTMLKFLH